MMWKGNLLKYFHIHRGTEEQYQMTSTFNMRKRMIQCMLSVFKLRLMMLKRSLNKQKRNKNNINLLNSINLHNSISNKWTMKKISTFFKQHNQPRISNSSNSKQTHSNNNHLMIIKLHQWTSKLINHSNNSSNSTVALMVLTHSEVSQCIRKTNKNLWISVECKIPSHLHQVVSCHHRETMNLMMIWMMRKGKELFKLKMTGKSAWEIYS